MSWQKYLCLASKSGNNKIIYQDILTAIADATNDLSMPCHKQQTDSATDDEFLNFVLQVKYFLDAADFINEYLFQQIIFFNSRP